MTVTETNSLQAAGAASRWGLRRVCRWLQPLLAMLPGGFELLFGLYYTQHVPYEAHACFVATAEEAQSPQGTPEEGRGGPMAGKPFSSTKTMKQAVLVRSEQASWFLATQTLFNQVAAFYFEVVRICDLTVSLSSPVTHILSTNWL